LIYFAISYNDSLILKNLYEKQTIDETKFFHSKNEVGKYISKSCIHVLNYLRNQIINNNKDNFLLKEILFYSTQLISLCLINPDFYLVGLRRGLQKNLEKNLMLISDKETGADKELLSFLDSTSIILEEKYELFYNFECKLSEIAVIIKIMIMDLFKKIQKTGYIMASEEAVEPSFPSVISYQNDEDKNMISGTKKKMIDLSHTNANLKMNREDTFFGESEYFKEKITKKRTMFEFSEEETKFNSLMLKSNFVFSVVKFLKIMASTNFNEKKENLDSDDSLINSILKLLYFFVDNNPDNCIIAICSHILNCLTNVENKNALKIFTFFHHCLKIITNNGFELTFTTTIVQVLGNFFFSFIVSY